jgi:predicted transcriptional regulator
MEERKAATRDVKARSGVLSVRATISFSPDLYETLEDLAKQRKVSLAWIVRDATEKYIAEQSPAAGKHKGKSEK